MVIHVTDYAGMQYRIYLLIESRTGYLLNRDSAKNPLCPCCLNSDHRACITNAVGLARADGLIEGKVRWVSGHSKYGEMVGKYGFWQNDFCHGTIEEVPPELLAELGRATTKSAPE